MNAFDILLKYRDTVPYVTPLALSGAPSRPGNPKRVISEDGISLTVSRYRNLGRCAAFLFLTERGVNRFWQNKKTQDRELFETTPVIPMLKQSGLTRDQQIVAPFKYEIGEGTQVVPTAICCDPTFIKDTYGDYSEYLSTPHYESQINSGMARLRGYTPDTLLVYISPYCGDDAAQFIDDSLISQSGGLAKIVYIISERHSIVLQAHWQTRDKQSGGVARILKRR